MPVLYSDKNCFGHWIQFLAWVIHRMLFSAEPSGSWKDIYVCRLVTGLPYLSRQLHSWEDQSTEQEKHNRFKKSKNYQNSSFLIKLSHVVTLVAIQQLHPQWNWQSKLLSDPYHVIKVLFCILIETEDNADPFFSSCRMLIGYFN